MNAIDDEVEAQIPGPSGPAARMGRRRTQDPCPPSKKSFLDSWQYNSFSHKSFFCWQAGYRFG